MNGSAYLNDQKVFTIVCQIPVAYCLPLHLVSPDITMTQSNGNAVSSASDPYRLNRNIAASTRLSLQHYIWKENMGYLLHPSIDVSRPDLAIADVGTGTAYGVSYTSLDR